MIRRFALMYAKSWMLLLWSALMICIGAGWMLIAIVGVLRMKGVL